MKVCLTVWLRNPVGFQELKTSYISFYWANICKWTSCVQSYSCSQPTPPLKSSFNKITLLIGVNQLKLFSAALCNLPPLTGWKVTKPIPLGLLDLERREWRKKGENLHTYQSSNVDPLSHGKLTGGKGDLLFVKCARCVFQFLRHSESNYSLMWKKSSQSELFVSIPPKAAVCHLLDLWPLEMKAYRIRPKGWEQLKVLESLISRILIGLYELYLL